MNLPPLSRSSNTLSSSNGERDGVRGTIVDVDFGKVMERMRRLRADISPHDSARRFTELGVDVFLGAGRFTGTDTIEVAGQTLRFTKAVIATGALAAAPPIPGLKDVPYLTNESLFSLTELPRRFGIIGAVRSAAKWRRASPGSDPRFAWSKQITGSSPAKTRKRRASSAARWNVINAAFFMGSHLHY